MTEGTCSFLKAAKQVHHDKQLYKLLRQASLYNLLKQQHVPDHHTDNAAAVDACTMLVNPYALACKALLNLQLESSKPYI